MPKFECNFDALEIEAHQIVSEPDGCGAGETHRYEPVDIDKGDTADVWSVFGHIPGAFACPAEGIGSGRKLIADCETPEAAEFIAGLVHEYLLISGIDTPISWYTDREKK
jgi:hypothetical protein